MLRQSAPNAVANDALRRCHFERSVVAVREKTTCFSAARKSHLASLRIIGNVLVRSNSHDARTAGAQTFCTWRLMETVPRRWKFDLLQRQHEASEGPQCHTAELGIICDGSAAFAPPSRLRPP